MKPGERRVGTCEEVEVQGTCAETGSGGWGGFGADSKMHELGNIFNGVGGEICGGVSGI